MGAAEPVTNTSSSDWAATAVNRQRLYFDSGATRDYNFRLAQLKKLKQSIIDHKDDIEKAVMAHEKTIAQLQGRSPKKVIIVPGKIVNIVG